MELNIKSIKKKIYDQTGSHLVFGKLVKHIDRSLNKELTILQIAFWLSLPEMQQEKSWSAFALQFFKRYRPDLEPWYGKKGMVEKKESITLKDQRLLIDLLGGMKKAGHLPTSSYSQIARVIKGSFDVSLSSSVLEKQLKEADVYIFNVFLEIYNSIYLGQNLEK